MKKIIIAILFVVLMAGTGYAVTTPTDEDYKNMGELRAKLVRMKREMDKFMKEIVATYPDEAMSGFGEDVKVDITETDKDVLVKADLPGMDKDKIDITLENYKTLKIAGTREMEAKEITPGVVRQERMSGKFERILELPVECMSEGIKATYKAGVLEVVIPKKVKGKPEAVKINVQ